MSSTLSTNTTAKLIGLAACGAAALGLSLDAALLTRTEDLLAALNAAGLLPGTTPSSTTPAVTAAAVEEPAVLNALGLPATPATQPELALGYELPPPPPPAGAHGILARAAKLNQTQV